MRDIAIVGMGCRFPGARNLPEYWRLLLSGRRQFRSVPMDRWDHSEYFDPNDKRASVRSYTDQVAVIEDVDQFDAAHFRMSPRRVQAMDPQHRLLLQVSREALQDAGWERREFDRASTGVFFAMSSSEYEEYSPDVKQIQPFTVPGVLLNMAAATVSQYYDLGGPSFTVDAACSSSLIALYEAVTHIRAGHCKEAIVGGAYLALAPNGLVGFAKVGALSQAGVCRPFDRRADGFVLGEGIGAMVLRPLADALAAGDRVYAVVRGIGCSNDGTADGPMTPRQDGQEAALRRAYADAECNFGSVGFIEAHGTATVVGDRTELDAIKAIRKADPAEGADQGAYLSSVKSMIGHSLSASGMASLIKTALVLHHETVVPQPDTEVEPAVGLAEAGLRIASEPTAWPAGAAPRRASVSGFGFGGTNVHVVLQDAPAVVETTSTAPERPELFLLSAGNPELLSDHIGQVLHDLDEQPTATARQLAYTLAQRQHLPARLAVVAAGLGELREKLSQAKGMLAEGKLGQLGEAGFAGKSPLPEKKRGVAFLFPGQGSQRPGMAGDLLDRFGTVREHATKLDGLLTTQAGFSALDALYGTAAATDAGRARLTGTDVCQPALGLLGMSAARLLADCAVRPQLTLGHSVGEFPAAAVAGVLSDEDALGLLATRGRRMRAAEAEVRGGMLALGADAARVEELVGDVDGAWASCFNHPGQTVVSGTDAGLAEVEKRCAANGISAKRLEVSNAFHSPLLNGTKEGSTADLAVAPLRAPEQTFVSSVSGGECADPERIRQLWAEHALAPVRFADSAQAAYQAGARVFVQLAGGRALLSTLRHNLREQDGAHYVPLSADQPDDCRTFLAALGELTVLGIPVDLAPLFDASERLLSLPPSPLRTRGYWVTPQEPAERFSVSQAAMAATAVAATAATAAPLDVPVAAPRTPAPAVASRSAARSAVSPLRPVKEHPVNDVVSLLREQLAVLKSFDPNAAEFAATVAPLPQAAVSTPAPQSVAAQPVAEQPDPQPVAAAPASQVAAEQLAAVRGVVYDNISRISAFPADQLDDDNLLVQELGFDSLMLTEMVGSVQLTWPQLAGKLVGGTIDPRPTIRQVVETLAGLLAVDTAAAAQPAPVAQPAAAQPTAPQPAATPAAAPQPAGTATQVVPETRIEDFPEAIALEAQLNEPGTRNPYFLLHEGTATATTKIEGRELVCFSSYNYLGLSGHPSIKKAVGDALDRYGSSVSASRFLSGDRPLHKELEAELSRLLGTEDSIVMVSGHATNVSVIGHLVGPGDLIVHDELAHDSILQGCKLSGARRLPFPHNDMAALDALLARARGQYRRALVVVEGVYSMDGDLVDLPKLIEVKEKHGALVLVDEAHSIGVVGKGGGGVGEHFGVDRSKIDLWAGTMSKSLSSCGGYVGGSAAVVRYLKYSVPGFVYSVGMTPPNTAAALAAIRTMRDEPARLDRLRANAELFLAESRQAGLDTGPSADSPVVPCIVGDSEMTVALADALFDRGISVNPIMYPAVPESEARLRFFITSEHTKKQIKSSVAAVAAELQRLRSAAGN